MIPFYFGVSDRRLYGAYDAPAGGISTKGVVICSAVGEEYYTAHRACRLLARQMAGVGIHALRFDYLGTGDSDREVDEVRTEDWLDDIERASQELMEMADLKTVGLVGLRAGAALAATVARRTSVIDQVVWWDPVTIPKEFLAKLGPSDAPGDLPEFLEIFSKSAPEKVSPRALLVGTGPKEEVYAPLASDLAAALPDFAFVHHGERGAWESGEDAFGSLPLPVRSLQTITDWLRNDG